MKRYHVRVGQTHALVEVDGGVMDAIYFFEKKTHAVQEPVDVHVQQIITNIREQPTSTVSVITRRDA